MHLSHFSHKHPLVFSEQQSNGNGAHCAGCDEPVIGPAYCCTVCKFYLHKRCAELPTAIHHPLHPQHTLSLLAQSPYPAALYTCDMCKSSRKGFVYHCFACEFNLDSNCAFHHSGIIPEFDISGDKKIITAKASGERDLISKERRNVGETGIPCNQKKKKKKKTGIPDTFVGKMRKAEAFEVKDSAKRESYKLGTLRGNPRPSADLLAENRFHLLLEMKCFKSAAEKRYQGETGKLDSIRGKKRDARRDKGKYIVKKEKKQQGEIGTSSDNIPSPCIFKSPFPKLEFQKPELVSVGPYHRDEEHRLDKYKHSFLEKLLHRTSNNPERDLCFYVEQVIALEERARACYSEDLVISRCDFVKMMLVDGCFTIELLRHFGGTEDDLFPEDSNPANIIIPWQIPILVQDLLLLENQIPFFVLEKLFELSKNDEGKPEVSLTTMALKFFDLAFPRSSHFISEFSHLKPNHLLDLFVMTISPSNPWNMSNLPRPTNRGKWNISLSFFKNIVFLFNKHISDLGDFIVIAFILAITATIGKVSGNHPPALSSLSASSSQHKRSKFKSKEAKHEQENQSSGRLGGIVALRQARKTPAELRQARKTGAGLLQARIAFRPSRSNSFLDFNFKDGILEIPLVTINNLFSTILVNSAALENCPYYNMPKPVTNYIYFMSCLIKEANDVQFLCSKGIISRLSNNDKKVADLFNLLRTYVSGHVSDSHFWKTMEEIHCYNGRSRKPMRQCLMETSVVLVMYCAVSLLIICLFYLRYITRKLTQFLSVFGAPT